MVKEIIKDTEFLSKTSEKVEFEESKEIIQDLLDTSNHYKDICVGLAAPQIGILKKIIVVKSGNSFFPMINPTIIKKFGKKFISIEGCLSLEGERKVDRYQSVMVNYMDKTGKTQTRTFSGLTSVIIQHEVDHLNGVLI